MSIGPLDRQLTSASSTLHDVQGDLSTPFTDKLILCGTEDMQLTSKLAMQSLCSTSIKYQVSLRRVERAVVIVPDLFYYRQWSSGVCMIPVWFNDVQVYSLEAVLHQGTQALSCHSLSTHPHRITAASPGLPYPPPYPVVCICAHVFACACSALDSDPEVSWQSISFTHR